MEPIIITDASGEAVATITPTGLGQVLVTSQRLLDREAVLALAGALGGIADQLEAPITAGE